jgi:hypothetical protein
MNPIRAMSANIKLISQSVFALTYNTTKNQHMNNTVENSYTILIPFNTPKARHATQKVFETLRQAGLLKPVFTYDSEFVFGYDEPNSDFIKVWLIEGEEIR